MNSLNSTAWQRVAFCAALVSAWSASAAQDDFDVLAKVTSSPYVSTSFISDSEGWLADTATLWHTTNGGASMETVYNGHGFIKLNFVDTLNGFALTDSQAFRTYDGGYTWELLSIDKIRGALCFSGKNTGFISGSHLVYKTLDGGTNWTAIPIEIFSFSDFFFINESSGIAVGQDNNGDKSIWKTDDGGLTWKNVFEKRNYSMNSVWFVNEDTGWAAGYRERSGITREPVILLSTDGGGIWKEVYRNINVTGRGEEFIDIRFSNEQEGFAVSSLFDNVFTKDGGLTWIRTYDSPDFILPYLGGWYTCLDGDTELYIAGTDGCVVKWKGPIAQAFFACTFSRWRMYTSG